MSHLQATLDEIEASFAINTRHTSRKDVDIRWAQELETVRAHRLSVGAVWFSLVFVLCLAIDRCLVGDVFILAMVLRLGIIVPLGLAVALSIVRGCSPTWCEGLSAALMVSGGATTAVVFLASSSPTVGQYHYLIGLPILFCNVVLRPRFRAAAVVTVLSLGIYVTALVVAALPWSWVLAAVIDMTLVACITLAASRNVEGELRTAFVNRVRSEKVVDHLAHRNDELRELSQIDTLTGVANRRRLDARLVGVADWSRRSGKSVALLMIDVDQFKQYNDRYGHPAGDRCLGRIANAAFDQIRRQDDEFGRFGGEEFLAILPETDLAGAIRVAERIRMAVESQAIPHEDSCSRGIVGISIGCAAAVFDGSRTIDDLLREADVALYAAKRRGRNRVHPEPQTEPGEGGPRSDPDDSKPAGRTVEAA